MPPLLFIALLFATDAPAPTAEDGAVERSVQVKLARPFRAGQVFSYAAVGRTYRQTVVSTQGAVVSESVRGTRCELAGALSIDSVRADGRPLELSVRVFRLVVREGFQPTDAAAQDAGAGEQPLATGTELKVRYPDEGAGEPSVTVAAGPELDPSLVAALRLVLPRPAERDDDLLFGRSEPTEIGASWAIDATQTARALALGGIDVAPERLEGEATLVAGDAGEGNYQVDVTLHGSRAGVPLPAGYVTRSGQLLVRLRSSLDEDPQQPPRRVEEEYSLHSQAMGREGEQLMVVDLAFFQTRNARYQQVVGMSLGAAE